MAQVRVEDERGRCGDVRRAGLPALTSGTWDTDSKRLDFNSIQIVDTKRVVLRHLEVSAAGDASVVRRDHAEDAVAIFGANPQWASKPCRRCSTISMRAPN